MKRILKKKKKILLSQNIAALSGDVVSKKGYVSAIDLFLALGWLTPNKLADWKIGKIPYLEAVLTANLAKLTKAMKEFRAWAVHSRLKPSITVYKHKGIQLRFSKSANPTIENAYSTHYVLIESDKQ